MRSVIDGNFVPASSRQSSHQAGPSCFLLRRVHVHSSSTSPMFGCTASAPGVLDYSNTHEHHSRTMWHSVGHGSNCYQQVSNIQDRAAKRRRIPSKLVLPDPQIERQLAELTVLCIVWLLTRRHVSPPWPSDWARRRGARSKPSASRGERGGPPPHHSSLDVLLRPPPVPLQPPPRVTPHRCGFGRSNQSLGPVVYKIRLTLSNSGGVHAGT